MKFTSLFLSHTSVAEITEQERRRRRVASRIINDSRRGVVGVIFFVPLRMSEYLERRASRFRMEIARRRRRHMTRAALSFINVIHAAVRH